MIRWEDLVKGDRVEIVALQNDPTPVPIGARGTVIASGRMQVLVAWDDPQHLNGLALPEDRECARKLEA